MSLSPYSPPFRKPHPWYPINPTLVDPAWRWAWRELLSGGWTGPGYAWDAVRHRLGVPDSGVATAVTQVGVGTQHDQISGATGERIGLGTIPNLPARLSALVYFRHDPFSFQSTFQSILDGKSVPFNFIIITIKQIFLVWSLW